MEGGPREVDTLVSQRGHSATLHRDRYLLIYGGRDSNSYWNTMYSIDIYVEGGEGRRKKEGGRRREEEGEEGGRRKE
jgi:hypothetical protein